MDLKTYLASIDEKQADFAARVNTTPATVSRLCAGTLRPSLKLAHDIERETKGKVQAESWLAIPETAEPTQAAA